jgi:antitoxin component of RelBE/YafQ-DinJ toxin-antitoxin module
MVKCGKQVPITLRLDEELYKAFQDGVASQGATYSGVLRLLIKKWLDEKRRK